MFEFYAQIKWVHVAAVISSGGLFALRGLLVLAGQSRWAMTPLLRYLSYTVDTVLLTAALMLLTILPSAMFSSGWLHVKVALLVVYVVLGTFALKRGRTAGVRAVCYMLAVLVFAFMITIARSHHPYGFALRWLG